MIEKLGYSKAVNQTSLYHLGTVLHCNIFLKKIVESVSFVLPIHLEGIACRIHVMNSWFNCSQLISELRKLVQNHHLCSALSVKD